MNIKKDCIMSIPKYKKFYTLMVEQNDNLFRNFDKTHSDFLINPSKFESQFHSLGLEVVDVIRFWERKLCSGMEKSTNGVYSNKLADKFWQEVRNRYSHIDLVGVKSSK